MNHKKYFIAILIFCLPFLLFSCSLSKDIDNNKKETLNIPIDFEDDTFEIIASKTINPTGTMTLTSTIIPTNTVSLSLTPTFTSTLTPTSTPTVTEVWRGSVPIERFDVIREQRTDQRIKDWQFYTFISPDETFGIIALEDNVFELWHFDDVSIASYIQSYIDVDNVYISPDSSKFAILYLNGKVSVYDRNGYLLTLFDDEVIESNRYNYRNDNKIQFSKNGEYIAIVNSFEGLNIYRTNGFDIPNMYYVSYDMRKDIIRQKKLFSKNHGTVLDDSTAWELVMQSSHFVTSGEKISTIFENKENIFNNDLHYEFYSIDDEQLGYGDYNLPFLDFSSNEYYATFFNSNNDSILIWSFEEEKIIKEININILDIVRNDDGSINYEVLTRFYKTSKINSSKKEKELSYITGNGLYLIDFQTEEKIYFPHFEKIMKKKL